MLSALALMVSAQVSFIEPFYKGDDVDLSQGFYVCQTADATILPKLAHIHNIKTRHQAANNLGCRFKLSDTPEIAHIISKDQDLCEKQTAGYSFEQTGKVAVVNCGIEGHRMTVTRLTKTYSVIWLSLDADYD